MDILAHGLWTYAVFHRKKYAWLATLFGILPDLATFGILFTINMINGSLQKGRPSLEALPTWIFASYNLTHSFIAFAVVFIAIYVITRKWFWPLAAWGLHILIDVPTHSLAFFPTPFLWPLSNYRFNGLSWGTGWFMLLNYSALIAVFIIISYNRAKEKRLSKKNK